MPPTPDAIDQALDVTHGAPLQALRAERADFVAGAEACRAAVLTPDEDLGLSVELRAAVARRVARGSHNARLIEGFPQPSDPELAALAAGEMPRDPALRLLGEHADRIAAAPAPAGPGICGPCKRRDIPWRRSSPCRSCWPMSAIRSVWCTGWAC